jgi:hypothetical protein
VPCKIHCTAGAGGLQHINARRLNSLIILTRR